VDPVDEAVADAAGDHRLLTQIRCRVGIRWSHRLTGLGTECYDHMTADAMRPAARRFRKEWR
jgi:hypothetical protein